MIRVNWEVEEIVPLIAVYLKAQTSEFDVNEELAALSVALNKRADQLGIEHDEKFRNLNGMKMMYQNVVYVATDGKEGLSAASQSLYAVYHMYKSSPEVFNMILSSFQKRYMT